MLTVTHKRTKRFNLSLAEQAIARARDFQLNAKDWKKFTTALDRPPQIKRRLKKLFAEPTIIERS